MNIVPQSSEKETEQKEDIAAPTEENPSKQQMTCLLFPRGKKKKKKGGRFNLFSPNMAHNLFHSNSIKIPTYSGLCRRTQHGRI